MKNLNRRWLVAYASQSGFGKALAQYYAQWLKALHFDTTLQSLAQLSPLDLAQHQQALFIVSTTGEGDAPGNARHWDGQLKFADLSGFSFGVLALGDTQYEDFCDFGLRFADILQLCGAKPLFDTVLADDGQPCDLAKWQQNLEAVLGSPMPSSLGERPTNHHWQTWTLSNRELLEDDRETSPCYCLTFTPKDASALNWQAGDIVQVALPSNDTTGMKKQPFREYSIASLPSEGVIKLLIRQRKTPQGKLGESSQYLTKTLSVGQTLSLSIRNNESFHLLNETPNQPAIFIGHGTGIAGLRALLHQRVQQQQTDNWLLFGSRYANADHYFFNDIKQWRDAGFLPQCDYVYSREQSEPEYVQHRLMREKVRLQQWVEKGAAIYVCGSKNTMGKEVQETLSEVLGAEGLDDLLHDKKYRRDLY